MAQAPGVSRRAFLGAAGAAGAVGALVATVGTQTARAAATARAYTTSRASAAASTVAAEPGHCFLGSNQDVFLQIRDGSPGNAPAAAGSRPVPPRPSVPGLRGVRIYGKKPSMGQNQLADGWPKGPSPADQGPIVYSIYPLPMTVLDRNNGQYTATIAAIQDIIASAPPESYLNSWHKALTLPGSTPPDATPAMMSDLHSALNEMGQGTNVTYGSIFGSAANFLVSPVQVPPANCAPPDGSPRMWDSVPDDLGFYGIDPYGPSDIDTYMCFLNTFITNAKSKAASGYPKSIIAETNNNDTDVNRVAWFDAVAQRMHTYGSNAVGILTFWKDDGPLSGPWDADPNIIDGMNNIIDTILV